MSSNQRTAVNSQEDLVCVLHHLVGHHFVLNFFRNGQPGPTSTLFFRRAPVDRRRAAGSSAGSWLSGGQLLFLSPVVRAAPHTVRVLRGPAVLQACVRAAVGHGHALYLQTQKGTMRRPQIQSLSPRGSTHLVLKSQVNVSAAHRIQGYFGKHPAVTGGSVQHLWTGCVVASVHGQLMSTSKLQHLKLIRFCFSRKLPEIVGEKNQHLNAS